MEQGAVQTAAMSANPRLSSGASVICEIAEKQSIGVQSAWITHLHKGEVGVISQERRLEGNSIPLVAAEIPAE
ncbi:conserved protein of unknown function [Methylorubrum extorquens DM4]|jgi:hypothetical protein|uniref:Uncharacterized protein n=1 Tax=Methylorubrum extorquens (strain DSM 6343 / CIP 106787 / DM4) TaxID=661410 RepID=C7CDJ5_METED|nr:conserved protein of unknown function [Methylorubrum extorquens DM4]